MFFLMERSDEQGAAQQVLQKELNMMKNRL